eukprot:3427865-Prymnesium_polylepis.1
MAQAVTAAVTMAVTMAVAGAVAEVRVRAGAARPLNRRLHWFSHAAMSNRCARACCASRRCGAAAA